TFRLGLIGGALEAGRGGIVAAVTRLIGAKSGTFELALEVAISPVPSLRMLGSNFLVTSLFSLFAAASAAASSLSEVSTIFSSPRPMKLEVAFEFWCKAPFDEPFADAI